MAGFLPTHHDFVKWHLSTGKQSEAHWNYLETIQHPWIITPDVARSWYNLLGIEDQLEPEVLENAPVIRYKGLIDVWNPRTHCKKWLVNGDIFLGGKIPIEFTDMKDYYLVRNRGTTKADRMFVEKCLADGKSINWIYK
jgi:hypothetical protein